MDQQQWQGDVVDVIPGGHSEAVLEAHQHRVPGPQARAEDSRWVGDQMEDHVHLGEV